MIGFLLRWLGRWLGWLFGLLTLMAVPVAGYIAWINPRLLLRSGGEAWYNLDVGSLNLAQAIVQRYFWPELWNTVILQVLLWPTLFGMLAWVATNALLALMFLALGARPERR